MVRDARKVNNFTVGETSGKMLTGWAGTGVLGRTGLVTRSSVHARKVVANVLHRLAQLANVSLETEARELEVSVVLANAVDARIRVARVDLGLAVAARVSDRTRARVVVERVHARAAVEARRAGAGVDLLGAERSGPSGLADAAEASRRRLHALCAVAAGRGSTRVYLDIAVGSREARRTGAVESVGHVDA